MKYLFRLIRQFFLRLLAQKSTLSFSFNKDETLVVIAPHPDDEVLGCGGLIAQAVKKKINITIIIMTGGDASHDNCCSISRETVKLERCKITTKTLRQLGLAPRQIFFLDWEDGNLPLPASSTFDSRTNELATLFSRLKPTKIFCPHPFEGWADHVAAQEITKEASKRSEVNATIYYYCVWFWYSMSFRKAFSCDWSNSLVLDIKEVYTQKKKAIAGYMTPCAPCGKPWSGVLPKELLTAFTWEKELFFKTNNKN